MFDFLKRKKKLNSSGDVAKKRLRIVVSRDRANVSADFLSRLGNELLNIAAKYIETDFEHASITIERCSNGTFLQARMPVTAYKDAVTA